MRGDMVTLYAYGVYLSNGGRPEDFLDFTEEDVQIMASTHMNLKKRDRYAMMRMFGMEEQ